VTLKLWNTETTYELEHNWHSSTSYKRIVDVVKMTLLAHDVPAAVFRTPTLVINGHAISEEATASDLCKLGYQQQPDWAPDSDPIELTVVF